MKNLLASPEGEGAVLVQMRKQYDAYLDLWRREGVNYHNYKPLARFFDRGLPWLSKKEALGVRK